MRLAWRLSRTDRRDRGPVLKASREEREANRRARERLRRLYLPRMLEIFAEYRTRVRDELRDQILLAGVVGVPEQSEAWVTAALAVTLTEALERAVGRGARIGLRHVGLPDLSLSAERIDSMARSFMRREGAERVVRVSEAVRTDLRRIAGRALAQNLSPGVAAEQIGQSAGLLPSQERRLRAFEERLIAARLPDPERATARARRTIAQDVERYRNRLLRERGNLILETETQTAIQHGERAFYEDAVYRGEIDRATLSRTWFTVLDADVCPTCEPLHGVTKPFDEVFASRRFRGESPPAHPRCRCYLEYEASPPLVAIE